MRADNASETVFTGMNISIRHYEQRDWKELLSVFRDASDTLRKSRGGTHPDDEIKALSGKADGELLKIILHGSIVFVAEVDGTGKLAGMGAITNHLPSRILNSTFSRNHYVRGAFQRGKAGISVGRLLREATLGEARRRGFRKVCGYSAPESVGFHRKFGAIFYPAHDDCLFGTVRLRYYEIELRKSIFNSIRVEPLVHRLGRDFGSLLGYLRRNGPA